MRRLCFVLLISACALFAQSADEPADAHGWLARGVQAFKNARYAEAAAAFQRAVDLDPSYVTAHLYLGTSLFEQYVPGASSPANMAFADQARAAFEELLTLEPDNKAALQYLASLAYQVAAGTADPEEKVRRLDDARSRYEKLLAVDPRNKEAWYSLGVIDWAKWYPKYMEALTQAGMKPDEPRPISNFNLREDLRNSSGPLVEDGISNLGKALEIDPRYDEAMAYMNLFVRERASLDDTVEQYEKDVALANDWMQKALDAKKAKAGGSAPPPPVPSRVRVGGNVQKCNLIARVDPVYPPLAKQARIQGTVRFQIVIGADGRVQDVQLVSGHPLLVEAARDAVQQWVYRPTVLNGQPVEIVTTVDVNFSLEETIGDTGPCAL
jgi:TonB family protein